MKITTVLFDLDGTLLSMDQDNFINTYLSALTAHIAPHGYDPAKFAKALWKGTGAMVLNDGSSLNEDVFWKVFAEYFDGIDVRGDEPYFDEFYRTKFDGVKVVSTYDAKSVEAVKHIKEKGFRTMLATNPLFPAIATEKRIAWAGLSPDDFEFYTSYENSSYSKPNPEYYKAILSRLGLVAEECLMVGNDVSDDMIAETLGMKVFLITNNLINKEGKDISVYPNGDFDDLMSYVDAL